MRRPAPEWVLFVILLGVSLSTHGYHSRDNDQAYRLPLLLHKQNPALFANDPFVRAFDHFNPHTGYLALIDGASRVLGLSAALAGLYFATYGIACFGLNRLARAVWPESGPHVGVIVVGLLLLAKAGNIGTNHLFEPILLDRGIAFALGWVALGALVGGSNYADATIALAVGAAALAHPSVGLQLAMLLATCRLVGCVLTRWTGWRWGRSLLAVAGLALAVVPGVWLNAGQGGLFEGLPADEFRILTAYVQSPQHMIPHLWRTPQWLAWGCYPVLAAVALASAPGWSRSQARLALVLVVNLLGLALAWVAIELAADLRVTLFQPFRMATVLRGVALVALAGKLRSLWEQGGLGRLRAVLLAVGLTGDWSLVVATALEVACAGGERMRLPLHVVRLVGLLVLAAGLFFLAKHDTESGHIRLLVGAGAVAIVEVWRLGRYGAGIADLKVGDRRGRNSLEPLAGIRGIAFGSAPGTRREADSALVEQEHGGRGPLLASAGRRGTLRLAPATLPESVADLNSSQLQQSDRVPGVERSDPPDAAARSVTVRSVSTTSQTSPRVPGAERSDAPDTVDSSGARARRRVALALVAAWAVPVAALLAPLFTGEANSTVQRLVQSLVKRCRFTETPTDDIERLALWCREHTLADARFIGPPAPKTFRLWSQRNLAFNRAGSPYHAAGLADWFSRFRDHVGFHGSAAEFSRAYLANRQELENRYQELTHTQLAELAIRQEAQYVIAAAPRNGRDAERQDRRSHAERGNEDFAVSPAKGYLTLLHTEGPFAVYQVNRCPAPDNR